MVNFFLQTGPFLIPLIGLSLYGVALMLEKNSVLKRGRALSDPQFDKVLEALHGQNYSLAQNELPSDRHPYKRLLDTSFRNAAKPQEQREAILQSLAQTELARLEERLSYFPALANLATLLGLFGTVCGMIISFLALRSGGSADPSALASGISQALVATAVGLIVAIPCLAAHAIFQKKTQSVALQMESLLLSLSSLRTNSGELSTF